MLPILILLAGAAFTTPVALADSHQLQLSTNPETLGAYVRDYFTNEPVMADIAWCESRMRHLNPDGTVFRGEKVREDIGVMQINAHYHEERAATMGLDIYSLEGNLAYAKFLYKKQGTTPWNSSRVCWGKLAAK